MIDFLNLKGKRALITAGTKGAGAATVPLSTARQPRQQIDFRSRR
jgi:hypothetical protein